MLSRKRPDWNIAVRGWWPRWRFRPATGGGAEISLDGKTAALLSGFGPREWKARIPPGTYHLRITNISSKSTIVFDAPVEVSDDKRFFVQFRGPFRRHWFGPIVPAVCWVLTYRPRPTWFEPKPPAEET